MNHFELTKSYIAALTGDPDSLIDWRVIHDSDKAAQAHAFRAKLSDIHQTLEQYNAAGYGVFCNINAMDGQGRDLANVAHIRTHVVDLDNTITAEANYQRAIQNNPMPHIAVQTSPGKFHLYWLVEPYTGNEFYTIQQRKLRQLYDGDKSVIDASRVLRVPGFYHRKAEPYLVTMWGIHGGPRHNVQTIADSLQTVNVFDSLNPRFPLGTKEMSAPSLEWLRFALSLVDPNEMDRAEWLSFSAAFKQAGWNHATPDMLYIIWQEWCNRYSQNDAPENLKLWNSVKDTEVGWTSIERRTSVQAYMNFGFKDAPAPRPAPPPSAALQTPVAQQPYIMPTAPDANQYAEILDAVECQKWFSDCYFIERTGEIFSRAGRFMNSTKFNGRYGGKHFIITSTGKTTDEAWKAALRSTVYTIPKVDHVRFLPSEPFMAIVLDEMGRRGLNTYIVPKIESREGDVSMWLNHVARILPNQEDQHIFFSYLAHCVKFPGFKIPWAILLQSAEGVGKTVFKEVLQASLGSMYLYNPKANELAQSGAKFNAWMRNRLMIIVDEIKVDERRELVEILKPMITDARIEIQSKGVDQDMEDNLSNWLFFSNFKDAVPITKNGRRIATFFSALQSEGDILNAGMDKDYFDRLFYWLRSEGGFAAITHWFMNYPIERGGLPVRAPKTSSHEEALRISRSPMEVVIHDCIADGMTGFRGGYISSVAVMNRVKASGIRTPSVRAIQSCLEGMGFVPIGKPNRAYAQEDVNNRSEIFASSNSLSVEAYGRAQGYE